MPPKKLRCLMMFLLCSNLAFSAYAETVYVDDRLRVGVRKEPGNRIAPHAIIHTGMQLEILEEAEDGYIRIKTKDGIEGWIRKNYITSERPAKERLQELMASHKKLQDEYEDLKAQAQNQNENESDKVFKALQKKNRDLETEIETLKKSISTNNANADSIEKLQELKNRNATLEAQLEELTSSPMQESETLHTTPNNIFMLVSTGILMLLTGFAAGFIWFRQQMIKKLEGANS